VAAKLDRISINPAIMNGQPCIRGMRLTVRQVVEAAALYPERNDLKREYPLALGRGYCSGIGVRRVTGPGN
jgi:uncharacterized protein (DUF433 family)